MATTTEHTVVTSKVVFPAAATKDERAFASLLVTTEETTRARERANDLLARSPVPVLAPTNVAFERPTFVVGPEFYALTGRVPSTSAHATSIATVSIHGKRAAHQYDDIPVIAGNRTVRSGKGFLSVNEGIRTASWIENGAAYSVDVECSEVLTDARCDSEAFVADIVEHLAFAGTGTVKP